MKSKMFPNHKVAVSFLTFLTLACGWEWEGYHDRFLQPIGYWNKWNPVGGVISKIVDVDPGSYNSDFFLNLFSTKGGPSMLQIHSQKEQNWKGFMNPSEAATGYTGSSDNSMLAITFPKLIEFIDENGDLKYDKGDTIVQEHSLDGYTNGVTAEEHFEWDKFDYRKLIPHNKKEVMRWATGVAEGELKDLVNIAFRATGDTVKMADGVELNPNRTKMDITLKNIPKRPDTLLALEGWVAAARAAASTVVHKAPVAVEVDATGKVGKVQWGPHGYIEWDATSPETPEGRENMIRVHASDFEDMKDTPPPEGTGTFWSHVGKFAKTEGGHTASVRRTYFTFSKNGAVTHSVHWDPAIQF